MAKRQSYELTTRMKLIEEAHPTPPPERLAEEQALTVRLLKIKNALDIAPLLGLEVPA